MDSDHARRRERKPAGKRRAASDARLSETSIGLPKDVPAVDAQEITVAGERTPARIGMLQQLRDGGATHLAGFRAPSVADWAGVIDDDVFASVGEMAWPDEDHRMKRRLLVKLPIEQQVAGA